MPFQSSTGSHGRSPGKRFVIPALLLLAGPTVAWASPPDFKLYLEHPGVYRVTQEDLAAAGLPGGGTPSVGLGISVAATPVPIWVEDGGDGSLDPGDWIEFIGEHLAGEASYLNEHSRFNVYNLSFNAPHQERMTARLPTSGGTDTGDPAAPDSEADVHGYLRRQHLEQDLLILRLPASGGDQPEELWYWARVVQNNREPFAQNLDLYDLAVAGGGNVELRLGFRGWSRPRTKASPEIADHSVQVSVGGVQVATAEWNGTKPYLLEVPPLAADSLTLGDNLLELKVPKRHVAKDGKTLIDVVMLNWIELSYPRHSRIGERQVRFELEDNSAQKEIRLKSESDQPLLLYGTRGSRAELEAFEHAGLRLLPAADESTFFATDREHLLSPEAIVLDRPSMLAATDNRADYIIIAHRKLLAAVEPLAVLHRSRGLEVAVVDVEDVYDEFHHGIAHPQALRSFLEHAHQHWARPAPRFVLLVGDASWDGKNALANDANYADWTYLPRETRKFGKNVSTAYAEDAHLNHRNLIPTWNYGTSQGHSASDNRFVSLGGYLPAMAIGRLPVVEPAEVAQIVDKTIRYVTRPEVGPWRRKALFITNESRGFQRQSDQVAGSISAAGFAPLKIYPASSEVSNEHNSARLIESFNDGQLFVHFIGHGGRYIWRTGPPDLKKNHDLFTLDHLDHLEPTGRLPVVVSLTCYSAPFDHPSADSIGEKLLRLPGRGAVAVFAASWRNSPSARWGQVLFEEMMKEGATVGEAIMRAKARIKNRMFVETYNLLGDPAAPVALPAGKLTLEASLEGGLLSVRGIVNLPEFSGPALVDLVDDSGNTLSTSVLELTGRELSAELEPSPEQLAATKTVRAYAWNQPRGIDAVGAVELAVPENTPSDAGAPSAGGDR